MALTHDLVNFKLSEFKHPELVNETAANMLDEIRTQCGFALTLTDDGRPPGDTPPDSAKDSLHFLGQAFDLRTRDLTAYQLFKLIDAVWNVAQWMARGQKSGVEVELVIGPEAPHIHVGFFLGARSFNTFEVRV